MSYTYEAGEMLALSFASYAGILEQDTAVVSARIRGLLDALPKTAAWELVWGPAVHRTALETFDEACMFVVRNTLLPSTYAVVVRGTNPVSICSWLLQDAWVREQVPWPGTHDDRLISRGTLLGLSRLSSMKADALSFSEPMSLLEYLRAVSPQNLLVTGHSLGGCMAPTLALWLTERMGLEVDSRVPRIYAFAGPTAGNRGFAEYSDAVLGENLLRYNNPWDVVPQAWNVNTLEDLKARYRKCWDHCIFDRLVDYTVDRVQGLDYTQPGRNLPVGPGYCSWLPLFLAQMIYQHTLAYLKGTDFEESMLTCLAPELRPELLVPEVGRRSHEALRSVCRSRR